MWNIICNEINTFIHKFCESVFIVIITVSVFKTTFVNNYENKISYVNVRILLVMVKTLKTRWHNKVECN